MIQYLRWHYFQEILNIAQSTQDITNWHPKAPDLTPPDTFCTRKEAVSFGTSCGRKLRYNEQIAAIAKGDETGDNYCICLFSGNICDSKLVTDGDEPAEEYLEDVMVQQEEIRKYKELCLKQVLLAANFAIKCGPIKMHKVY